jgi:DNA-binding MarR family transcriptional regulator
MSEKKPNFDEYIRLGEPSKKECAQICTLDCTLEEFAVLEFLKERPMATQKEVAAQIKKSERTVKTITVSLQDKGLLKRTGGRRNGLWEVTTS